MVDPALLFDAGTLAAAGGAIAAVLRGVDTIKTALESVQSTIEDANQPNPVYAAELQDDGPVHLYDPKFGHVLCGARPYRDGVTLAKGEEATCSACNTIFENQGDRT